ncbi:MAG: VOC family protein [Burkholderiaceae bacterium]|nr:VOC family protein [Burkholderiaceae bacterium]
MKLQFNFFCRDIEAQLRFYRELLGLAEAVYTRSPVYRALHTVDFQIGFHAPAAYAMLGLPARAGDGAAAPDGYPSLMLESAAAVDAVAARVAALGGSVIKGPFATCYGQWQAVIRDPEGHMFRISSDELPEGVAAPAGPY